MARLFDNPMSMLLILLVVMLLFGAPKLPGMARSLGQSMRILKSEVTELKDDHPAQTQESIKGRSAHENQGITAPRS
ncbi:twin-arginine translocase TatA/TatE family subunit [Kocuria sp. KH4]